MVRRGQVHQDSSGSSSQYSVAGDEVRRSLSSALRITATLATADVASDIAVAVLVGMHGMVIPAMIATYAIGLHLAASYAILLSSLSNASDSQGLQGTLLCFGFPLVPLLIDLGLLLEAFGQKVGALPQWPADASEEPELSLGGQLGLLLQVGRWCRVTRHLLHAVLEGLPMAVLQSCLVMVIGATAGREAQWLALVVFVSLCLTLSNLVLVGHEAREAAKLAGLSAIAFGRRQVHGCNLPLSALKANALRECVCEVRERPTVLRTSTHALLDAARRHKRPRDPPRPTPSHPHPLIRILSPLNPCVLPVCAHRSCRCCLTRLRASRVRCTLTTRRSRVSTSWRVLVRLSQASSGSSHSQSARTRRCGAYASTASGSI